MIRTIIIAALLFVLCPLTNATEIVEDYSSPESLFQTHLEAIQNDRFDILMRAYSPEVKTLLEGKTDDEKMASFREFVLEGFQDVGKDYTKLELEIISIEPSSQMTETFGYETVDIFFVNKTIETQGRLIASNIDGEWKVNFPVKAMMGEEK